jgi:hypothetical protein
MLKERATWLRIYANKGKFTMKFRFNRWSPDLRLRQGIGSHFGELLRGLDVLRLEAYTYETGGELLEAGDAGEDL